MSRPIIRSGVLAGALGLLLSPQELHAAPVFLLDATETTIFDVLPAWTQADACDCCVCWETALGTIFSYWDDVYYPGLGPWESLLLFGNRDSAPAFKATTGALWQLSGLACDEGASSIPFWSYEARDVAEAYTQSLGYAFGYDVDEWVWFGTDIGDEIDADRPVYYAYEPEGNSAHAVTLVGYDASDETLYLYKNWDPVLTLKGFDEATNHRTINVTPGGAASVPGDWLCSAAAYEGDDGCDCTCGSYDPDCDNELVALGCEPGQSCSSEGECVGCDDECAPPEGSRCADEGSIVSCADTDADGCLELGAPVACGAGSICRDGNCLECTCEVPDATRCTDETHVQSCTPMVPGCASWGSATACADGALCTDGACASGAGGVGASGSGGGGATGGDSSTPLPPPAVMDPPEESGCCTVAPGRTSQAPGRSLLALAASCAALWRRRSKSRSGVRSRN